MIPVKQTKVGYPNGNCYAACIASLLEMPLEEMPVVVADAKFNEIWDAWFAARGIARLCFTYSPDHVFKGWMIICGLSPRDVVNENGERVHHAVVGRDCVPVFDPHPDASDAFFEGSPTEVDILYPLDPQQLAGGAR
jgi:hypothetical protein